MSAPVLFIALILRLIDSFKQYASSSRSTGGGPGSSTETVSFSVAKTAFSYFYTGEASALAVILLIIIIGLSMILVRHLGKNGREVLMAEIKLDRLTIDFAGFKAVDNVDLTVKNARVRLYLGPSGCGKTTTLRCIAGLVKGDVRRRPLSTGGGSTNCRPASATLPWCSSSSRSTRI